MTDVPQLKCPKSWCAGQTQQTACRGGWAFLQRSAWALFSPTNHFYTLTFQSHFVVCFYQNQKQFPGLSPNQTSGSYCLCAGTSPLLQTLWMKERKRGDSACRRLFVWEEWLLRAEKKRVRSQLLQEQYSHFVVAWSASANSFCLSEYMDAGPVHGALCCPRNGFSVTVMVWFYWNL